MFACVIERWVAMAALSDSWETRQGHHSRASDWPEQLVCAEHDRDRFDMQLCWATASHAADCRDRALAFAMATHPRLGALSPALCLVGDLVRQVAGSPCAPPPELLYTAYLHAHAVPEMTVSAHPVHRRVFTGVPVGCFVAGTAAAAPVIRRLLKSEEEHKPSYTWPGRAPFFFCQRGWFAGVAAHNAPHDAVGDGVLRGVFESVPHVFCDMWFPICRPFAVCMHLVHVSYIATRNVVT